jgi:ABC-2 type transport system permease protein
MIARIRGMIARLRRRGRHRTRAAALAAGMITLLALSVSGCGSTGLTAPSLQTSLSRTFANLYVLQQAEQGNPKPSAASLDSHASCQKGGTLDIPQDGSGVWLCQITYLVAGPGYPVIAKYNVDVQTDGCYAADGDGPASVNGSPTITGPHYAQLINPLSLIDGCFDTT